MRQIKRAYISRSWLITGSSLLLAGIVAWMARHMIELISVTELTGGQLNFVWFLSFTMIAWTTMMAMLERPIKATTEEMDELDKLKVVVLIPAYNEDPRLLGASIQSMLDQTRKPDEIVVVDDGSTIVNYEPIKKWLRKTTDDRTTLTWFRTVNGGKRHAQGIGINHASDADIYVTVDSDTVLDPKAISEGLKPFKNDKVMSVAGVCLPLNVNENLLTRFTGLFETVWQLTERSSQSTMGCVTVNTGQLALYRGDIIRKNLNGYLNETFFGRPVKYSDDSLMTIYSMMEGRTIQQPTSISFSAVPNQTSHHIRRYIRWMRGSFIRTWWRFRYLPMTSYIYWLHLARWMQFALSTVIVIYLLTNGTLTNPELIPYLILVPIVISYMTSLRYLMIRRNDISFASEFVTYLTAPVVMLWSLTVLRVVKWYAYATVLNMKWGTREKMELQGQEGTA